MPEHAYERQTVGRCFQVAAGRAAPCTFDRASADFVPVEKAGGRGLESKPATEMKRIDFRQAMVLLALLAPAVAVVASVRIAREIPLVSDPLQYKAFPGICRAPNGDILVVFRNAPNRPRVTHLDPSSRCLLVRSREGGRTFDTEHPATVFSAGGLQDRSITALRDGRLVANAFRWNFVLRTLTI